MNTEYRDFNVESVRKDFPILSRRINNQPLVYLDNAATTQKPMAVVRAISNYYQQNNANVHRATHVLAEEATKMLEESREKVRRFINAGDSAQIIWTRGTTESLNLIASSYAGTILKPKDEILLTAMEHHSNIVPWQLVAERTGAVIRVIPVSKHGVLDMEVFSSLLCERTKILAMVHASNSLGTINPVAEMTKQAHLVGAVVVVDGAQSMLHMPIDVQHLDVDFYAFSGHKMLGPTGIGVLYGKLDLLDFMPPYQGGGEMIERVSFDKTTYNRLPYKFEAGTPDIAGAIGMNAALDYLNQFKNQEVLLHEQQLSAKLAAGLRAIDDLTLIGTAENKIGVVSFAIAGCHPYDLGMLLDQKAVAVRTGTHCTMPLMSALGIANGTVRASLCLYNNHQDIEILLEAVKEARNLLV